MSYCVHCGVELGEHLTVCPLCQTPMQDPARLTPVGEPFFSQNKVEVQPVSKRELALLLTVLLTSASGCCAVLNLFLRSAHTWSLYVIGAAVMLWIWLVPPLLARRLPAWTRVILDFGAIGSYVWLISVDLAGAHWFYGLALPLIGGGCGVSLVLCLLLWGQGHSMLSSITMVIGAAGLYLLFMETSIDRFFTGQVYLGWSLITLTICVGTVIPLVVIRRVPSLRQEASRRFHI